jgi:Alpha amylase, catalytic domain
VSTWCQYPTILEVNTWVWLADLSGKYGYPVDLGSVPDSEWNAIGELGFDAVWLMGVWERSPAGIEVSNANPGLTADFRRALPDFRVEDNVGSAYCIRDYRVDPHLGGQENLAVARNQLASQGMKLILDFVPNHTALDHSFASQHPEYYLRGDAIDLQRDPASFIEIDQKIFARGRDPYFPAWPDVLQLNAFDPGLRRAVEETILGIANLCDGIRCDMAMLLLNQIFERTWGARAGRPPETDYWAKVIQAVKKTRPDFLFIAEAYWDLESELQQQGFDYCYDKRLYDRLKHDSADSIRSHLCADAGYQAKLVRFIENHDEPRASATFSSAQQRAAAVVMATTPGARLFHEGQLEGREVRIPVFLRRRPNEPEHQELKAFYRKLLQAVDHSLFHEGNWKLSEASGWPDNQSFRNIVAWTWTSESDRCVIIVNLSGVASQARVRVPWSDSGAVVRLTDPLTGASYDRDANEMQGAGLYVDLPGWGVHFFECGRRIGTLQRAA